MNAPPPPSSNSYNKKTGIFHKTFYLYQKNSEILKGQKTEIPDPTIDAYDGLNENVPLRLVYLKCIIS